MHRAILDSELMDKPPHYLKVWVYLLLNAEWRDCTRRGHKLKRGQVLTSYSELLQMLKYEVGNRKRLYKPHHLDTILKLLRKRVMIRSRKLVTGFIVTILNYEKYQAREIPETGAETGTETGTETGIYPFIEELIKNHYGEIKFPEGFPVEKFATWEIARRKNNHAPKMTPAMRKTALTHILNAKSRPEAFRGIGYNSVTELLDQAAENRWRGFSWLKQKLNQWENTQERIKSDRAVKDQARPTPPDFDESMVR